MASHFHYCNSTDVWTLVEVHYFSDQCRLVASGFNPPSYLIYYLFTGMLVVVSLLINILFVWKNFRDMRTFAAPYLSPRGDAVNARLPDGYWAEVLTNGTPTFTSFRAMLGR